MIPARPAPPHGPRRKAWIVAALLALALGGLAMLLQRQATHQREMLRGGDIAAAADDAARQLRESLPLPYGPGLEFTDARAEGKRLVLLIRSDTLDADAAARDPEALGKARLGAHDLLLAFCDDGAMRALLDQGLVIVRRFEGRDATLLFEVAISANDCAGRPRPQPLT